MVSSPMPERTPRQQSRLAVALKNSSWVLLAVQYAAFVVLVHHSRIMTPAGGRRYLTSTAVVLNEVIKLSVSLTMALYEVSKTAPASMPATSLLSSLASAVFSGDSWKLVIPACLYTLANSLQYIGLSNYQASTFLVTYQLKLLVSAIFGVMLLRRTLPPRKWGALLLLVVGVALVQISDDGTKGMQRQDEEMRLSFPRTLDEWKAVKGGGAGKLGKRSATYEGIEEDMLTIFPLFNSMVGLLTTVGACCASGVAGVAFEKVLRDSAKSTSLWIRNVQLAMYSIFPAFFIGVVFLDGEKIGTNGFFQGYNWTVWLSIILQAVGGIAAAFSINYASKGLATATGIVFSTLGSVYLLEFKLSFHFMVGATVVLLAIYLYGNPNAELSPGKFQARPAPVRVKSLDKYAEAGQALSGDEYAVKLPTTPILNDEGLSSSRPGSPSHMRSGSRQASSGSYFAR